MSERRRQGWRRFQRSEKASRKWHGDLETPVAEAATPAIFLVDCVPDGFLDRCLGHDGRLQIADTGRRGPEWILPGAGRGAPAVRARSFCRLPRCGLALPSKGRLPNNSAVTLRNFNSVVAAIANCWAKPGDDGKVIALQAAVAFSRIVNKGRTPGNRHDWRRTPAWSPTRPQPNLPCLRIRDPGNEREICG